jgi:hypothetical protein
MNLVDITLNEISQTQKDKHGMYGIKKFKNVNLNAA